MPVLFFMNCKFCSQNDESRLALSSRLVNGKVIHEWVCLDCLWAGLFMFMKEDGKTLSEKPGGRDSGRCETKY